MSELEKTRQQIEEIKRQAEERKLAQEKEKLSQEEKERKRIEAERTLKQVCWEKFLAVKDSVPKLLEAVNRELLDGKGKVMSWKKTSTKAHRHDAKTESGCDSSDLHESLGLVMGVSSPELNNHKSEQLESSLHIPGIGSIVVFCPLNTQWGADTKERMGWKVVWNEPRAERATLRVVHKSLTDTEQYVCSTMGQAIPLDIPEDKVLEQLEESILHQVVCLHEKALGV